MAVSVSTVMRIHRLASRNRPLTVKVLLVFAALSGACALVFCLEHKGVKVP